MSDFGPMAIQTSKPHSSAVECDFLNGYEGAPAMRGNKVPRYGKGVILSGAAHHPKIVHIGDELRVDSFRLRGERDDLLGTKPRRSATVRPMGSLVRGRRGLKIRRRYGRAALEIVDGGTDSRSKPKPPFRERKESYIAKLLPH